MLGLFNNKRAQETEPVIGYKYWNTEPSGLLQSPAYSSRSSWIPGKRTEAICKYGQSSHFWPEFFSGPKIPLDSCTCGIYAYSRGHATFQRCVEWGVRPDVHQIYGLVYLWGTVIVCRDGFRAQYAYPKAFIYDPSIEGSLKKAQLSANLYGAELIPIDKVRCNNAITPRFCGRTH